MQKEVLFKCGENTKKINEQKRIFTENGFFLNYTFSISRVEHSTYSPWFPVSSVSVYLSQLLRKYDRIYGSCEGVAKMVSV